MSIKIRKVEKESSIAIFESSTEYGIATGFKIEDGVMKFFVRSHYIDLSYKVINTRPFFENINFRKDNVYNLKCDNGNKTVDVCFIMSERYSGILFKGEQDLFKIDINIVDLREMLLNAKALHLLK